MADVAAPAKSPAKKAAKPRKPAKPAAHPKYSVMIAAAIASLKERSGSSRQAVLKYILANYKVGNELTKINARVKAALKAGVKAGTLKQAKGTGASGSFRLGEKKVAAVKKPKAATKKPAAKKPKAAGAAKKAKSPKKAAAKKPKVAKSPKKVAVKKPQKAKSPAKKATAKPKKAKTPKKAAAKKAAKKWETTSALLPVVLVYIVFIIILIHGPFQGLLLFPRRVDILLQKLLTPSHPCVFCPLFHCPLSLEGAARSIIFYVCHNQRRLLSQQKHAGRNKSFCCGKHFCHAKTFVTTNIILSQQAYFYHDKLLSRQTHVCCNKISCRHKSMFVMTSICCNKHTFVAVSILLLQQKMCFVATKHVCRDKNNTCGSSHQW